MSDSIKETKDNNTIKQNNNLSDEDEELLQTLNISSLKDKNKIKSDVSRENENKINDNKDSKNEEQEIDDANDNKKYIKKYKSKDLRLNGITFQSSTESNIINLAVSSLNMNLNNNISILSFSQEEIFQESNDGKEEPINNSLTLKAQVECTFPVSSILFSPHEQNKNLLISTSDVLRVYSYDNEVIKQVNMTKKREDFNGPLTACDWSKVNDSIVGVCSVDTTCALWDVNQLKVKYMAIAHDKEVYDISLGPDEFSFMSTGADSSVRFFDSRDANSSCIIFETRDESPISRIKWNLVNPNFLIVVIVDKNAIYILDQRKITQTYAILNFHTNVVNNAIWAPQSNTNLISVSDDKTALIWDINSNSKQPEVILKYEAENEIENVAWGDITKNWIGLIHENQVEILRIQ
jgi:WD repeat-containing protein 68